MATVAAPMTAEEFCRLSDNGQLSELVRGEVVDMNMPSTRHGFICARVAKLLDVFVGERDLGRVGTNDSGIVTQRDPDTVRGADVAYYSYERLPKGRVPDGYVPVPPDLVIEVLSVFDRWNEVLEKTAEYLSAGVRVVCVLDPSAETAHVYRSDRAAEILRADEELSLPEVLGEFRVVVRRFFE